MQDAQAAHTQNLINVLTNQRNNAANEAAMLAAQVQTLQATLIDRDKEIEELKAKTAAQENGA